jgi:hypothetical protein
VNAGALAGLMSVGLLCAACSSLGAERAAVIDGPDARARAELTRVVTLALDGAPVALADDAFTHASALSIERRTPAGPQGRAATGRSLEAPVRLHLVLAGSRCELVRDRDGRRFALDGVRCSAADTAR